MTKELNFPRRMLVWDSPKMKLNRLVIGKTFDNKVIAILPESEEFYDKGRFFECALWERYEEITKESA